MLEHAGGAPLESAALLFPGGESAVLALNVQSTGQGHATVFPHVAAERLGIPGGEDPPSARRFRSRTSPAWPRSASRSAMTAGSAIVKTVDTMLAKGKTIAANVLEAAEADIDYRDGHFEVVGTDRRISLFELAGARRRDEEARRDSRKPRHQGHHRDAADLSERLPRRRGRDRSRYRPASRSSPTRRSTIAATCSTT